MPLKNIQWITNGVEYFYTGPLRVKRDLAKFQKYPDLRHLRLFKVRGSCFPQEKAAMHEIVYIKFQKDSLKFTDKEMETSRE